MQEERTVDEARKAMSKKKAPTKKEVEAENVKLREQLAELSGTPAESNGISANGIAIPPELLQTIDRAMKAVEVVADSFQRIAKAYEAAADFDQERASAFEPEELEAKTSPPAVTPKAEAKKAEAESTTLNQPVAMEVVAAAINKKISAGGVEELKDILSAFGVQRAGELSETDRAKFVVALGVE